MLLSPRDKLSLAITSAGSMRKLAALVGSSHQQIGRWLTTDPERQSPIPAQWNKAIDTAFKIHVQLTRDQARAHGLPFIADAPVFQRKGWIQFGPLGGRLTSRVITSHTEHLSRELRKLFLQGMFRTQMFIRVVARSLLSAAIYARMPARDQPSKKRDFNDDHRELIREDATISIYTKRGQFKNTPRTRMDERTAVNGVLSQLDSRHAPAARALGDKMLFEIDIKPDTPKHARNTPSHRKPGARAKPRTKARKATPPKRRR